jgi:hypothetical protein
MFMSMSKRFLTTTIGFAAALLLAGSSAAQSVSLKPKFTAGKTDYFEQNEDIEQTMKGPMAPEGMTMKIKQIYGLKRTVEAAEKDKSRIKYTYDRLAAAFDGPMMPPIDYDSDRKTNDVDAETYEQIFKLMLGESVKAEIGPDGRAQNVTGMKDIVAKVDKEVAGNMFWPQMKGYFTDESFGVQMINMRAGLLPNKDVKPGDTWTATLREKMPNVGTLVNELKCTLKGVDKKDGRTVATIEYDGKISSEPAEKAEPNEMGMTAKVDSGETKGVAEFDVDAGDFVRTQVETKMNMSVAMGGGGAAPDGEAGMKLSLRTKGGIRSISDKERAEQKKANSEKSAEKASEKSAPKSEKSDAPK